MTSHSAHFPLEIREESMTFCPERKDHVDSQDFSKTEGRRLVCRLAEREKRSQQRRRSEPIKVGAEKPRPRAVKSCQRRRCAGGKVPAGEGDRASQEGGHRALGGDDGAHRHAGFLSLE